MVMEARVSLVIKSHLNDVMAEMEVDPILSYKRLQFVKYLVHMFPNTDTKIDVEAVYNQFELSVR
jgi:hypothetical protein